MPRAGAKHREHTERSEQNDAQPGFQHFAEGKNTEAIGDAERCPEGGTADGAAGGVLPAGDRALL